MYPYSNRYPVEQIHGEVVTCYQTYIIYISRNCMIISMVIPCHVYKNRRIKWLVNKSNMITVYHLYTHMPMYKLYPYIMTLRDKVSLRLMKLNFYLADLVMGSKALYFVQAMDAKV